MAEKPLASLQTIAETAQVSRSTVSLALRDDPRIARETRRRIQAIARDLGYRPHPLYSTLLSQVRAGRPVHQRETLAFITAFPTRDGWRRASFLYSEYFDGVRQRADDLGFRVDEIWAKEPGMTGQRLTGILMARGIRGILIAPLPRARGHLTLDWPRFAAATCNCSGSLPKREAT